MTEKHSEQSDSEFHFVYSWTICNKNNTAVMLLMWFLLGSLSNNYILSCLENIICRHSTIIQYNPIYTWCILCWCFYNATTFSVGYINLISSQLFFSSRWSKWKFCILSQIDGPKLQEDLYLLAEFRCYCKSAMKALHAERVAELHSVFLLCHHICLETTPMKHHGKLPARLLLSHLIMSIYCPRLTLSTWITC